MRAARVLLVWLTLTLVLGGACLASNSKKSGQAEAILGLPCAAFSRDGRWATGVFTPTALRIDLGSPSGESQFFHLPVVLGQISPLSDLPACSLFFSPNGRYLAAAGFLHDGNVQRLHVGVLSTGAGRWVSSFDVRPQGTMQTYLELAGFLRDTEVLIVTGENAADSRGRTTATTSVAFDLEGNILQSSGESRVDPPDLSGWERRDVKHNRLWGFGAGTSTPCHWRSVTLTGRLVSGPSFDKRAVGNIACSSSFVAFPDGSTIAGAGDNSNHSWVWRVDLPTDSGEKLQLPESRPAPFTTWNAYTVMGGSLSPDGRIFVIDRNHAEWGSLHAHHQKPDVLTAVQVRPLRVLGTVHLRHVCPVRALAADHRDEEIKAIVYLCGKWENVLIPPASRK